jgi:hypothetical protein
VKKRLRKKRIDRLKRELDRIDKSYKEHPPEAVTYRIPKPRLELSFSYCGEFKLGGMVFTAPEDGTYLVNGKWVEAKKGDGLLVELDRGSMKETTQPSAKTPDVP